MDKLKSTIHKGKKGVTVITTMRIPPALGEVITSGVLNQDEKINLVRSWSQETATANESDENVISNQAAVILIMSLEVGAL